MKEVIKKNFLFIFLCLYLTIIVSPQASAALTTADAISSTGLLMMVFLLGMGSAIIGVVLSFKETKINKVLGLVLGGFGLLMLLVAINMSIAINNEMATSFTEPLGKAVVISSQLIKVLSYLVLGVMFFMIAYSYKSFLSSKKASDGWDGNNY